MALHSLNRATPAAEAPESETPASDASGDGAPETDPAALAAASSSKTDHEAVKEALEGKAREGGPADASADPAVEAAGAAIPRNMLLGSVLGPKPTSRSGSVAAKYCCHSGATDEGSSRNR